MIIASFGVDGKIKIPFVSSEHKKWFVALNFAPMEASHCFTMRKWFWIRCILHSWHHFIAFFDWALVAFNSRQQIQKPWHEIRVWKVHQTTTNEYERCQSTVSRLGFTEPIIKTRAQVLISLQNDTQVKRFASCFTFSIGNAHAEIVSHLKWFRNGIHRCEI